MGDKLTRQVLSAIRSQGQWGNIVIIAGDCDCDYLIVPVGRLPVWYFIVCVRVFDSLTLMLSYIHTIQYSTVNIKSIDLIIDII